MNSLFSIPRNKRFVCVNTDPDIRIDPLTESINRLAYFISQKEKSKFNGDCDDQSDSDDEIRPFNGFAKPLNRYKNVDETFSNANNSNRLLQLIDEHVEEALQNGFDDSIAKYKGKNHFVVCTFLLLLFRCCIYMARKIFLFPINSIRYLFRYHHRDNGMRCSSVFIRFS